MQDEGSLRAYSDPVIFRDDRVLKTLLRKESKYVPNVVESTSRLDRETRKQVVEWMLEVCEDQASPCEVFCLAVNYLDRFVSSCRVAKRQLQLLAAVCLLVARKVREHEPLPAFSLVEYSDFNFTILDIMVSKHALFMS